VSSAVLGEIAFIVVFATAGWFGIRRRSLPAGTIAAWLGAAAIVFIVGAIEWPAAGQIPCRMEDGSIWLVVPSSDRPWQFSSFGLGKRHVVREGEADPSVLDCAPSRIRSEELGSLRNGKIESLDLKLADGVATLTVGHDLLGRFTTRYCFDAGHVSGVCWSAFNEAQPSAPRQSAWSTRSL
jgi:hypothetical protein